MDHILERIHSILVGLGIREGRMLPWGPTTRDEVQHHKRFHNASFFLGNGTYVGWGDLSWEDIQNILERLPAGVAFCIVEEMQMSELRGSSNKNVLPENLAKQLRLILKDGMQYVVNGWEMDSDQPGVIDNFTPEGQEKIKSLL